MGWDDGEVCLVCRRRRGRRRRRRNKQRFLLLLPLSTPLLPLPPPTVPLPLERTPLLLGSRHRSHLHLPNRFHAVRGVLRDLLRGRRTDRTWRIHEMTDLYSIQKINISTPVIPPPRPTHRSLPTTPPPRASTPAASRGTNSAARRRARCLWRGRRCGGSRGESLHVGGPRCRLCGWRCAGGWTWLGRGKRTVFAYPAIWPRKRCKRRQMMIIIDDY